MKLLTKIVLLTLALPLFANSVATVTALKGDVKIKNETSTIEAVLGAPLEEKDNVITADKSKAQIIFKDDTIITIGKNSDFSIAKYIFEANAEPVARFSLLKGSMRTITGKIGKIAPQKFIVRTKTATIGIRGTNFTIITGEKESFSVFCTYGAISVVVNNKTTIVPHGFYFHYTTNKKRVVKPFTTQKLQNIRKKYFGKEVALKGAVSKDEMQPKSDPIIDNTTVNNQIVVKSITDTARDAIQITQSEQTEPQSSFITMKGFSVDTDYGTQMSAVANLRFTPDGSSFDTANSYVEVLHRWNQSENSNHIEEFDDWKFILASTSASFTSRDDFTTSFASVTLTPGQNSSSKNAKLSDSSFKTMEDLSVDDKMSWGTWNAKVTYESNDYNGKPISRSRDFNGLWISGEPTDTSVLDGLTTTIRKYVGEFQAYQTDVNTPTLEGGVATLYVDFGANIADLTIHDNSNNNGTIFGNYTYDMTRSGNQLNSTAVNYSSGAVHGSANGSANGTFYGAEGKSVGGSFHISDNLNTQVKGVYEVQAP